MKNLLFCNFTSQNGAVLPAADGAQTLLAQRAPIGEKFMPEDPAFAFWLKGPVETEEYAVIEYMAFGVKRDPLVFKGPFMTLHRAGEHQPVFRFEDLILDQNRHSIIAKVPGGIFDGAKIEFHVDKVPQACMTIHRLYTCAKAELPIACAKGMSVPARPFTMLDIADQFDTAYCLDEVESCVDAGRFFDKADQTLYGVPFRVRPEGSNLVAPPPPPAENDEIIENFGAKARRRICRPVSRDGKTVIPVNKHASELFFILTLAGKRHMRCGYGSDPTILGSAQFDINEPLQVTDVEMFMVEVVYRDGRRDTHLPLNLGTGRHGLSGDIGVYGVPCFGLVESLVLHNRLLDTDVRLAAVTVNETDARLYADMLIPQKEPVIKRKSASSKAIQLEGNTLTVNNGALNIKLNIAGGLYLLEMTNAFTPVLHVKPDALLKTRAADGTLESSFALEAVQLQENSAILAYSREGVRFVVTVGIEDDNSVRWNLAVTNETLTEWQKGILFPNLSGIDFGSFADNWYYLPKYQDIDSNETFYMYEESAPSFPLQFMDVYSPNMQGGICISTQEQELVTRKYALTKSGQGMDVYVEYPIIYGDIAPGETFAASTCLVTGHAGGWKNALRLYQAWLSSWYAPYKCQDKQWYRECFWLLAEITVFFETRDMCAFPCWYDPGTKEFKLHKILEEQKSIAGVYPDILHMWSWCTWWRNGRYGQRWGNYGKEDYDYYGGQQTFRDALHDIRDNMGIQMSLYMHPTLLSNSYAKAEKFYQTSMVKNENGDRIGLYNDSFRMCHAEESWREESLSMYPRLYSELGIPLLYVDEFSLRIENRCYARDHGHHVPSNLLKTDRDYITRLKESMPREVVLYGEYAAADVNARYIDCNISYYILDSIVDMIETTKRANNGDDRLGRVFNHAYRFVFPKIVQLVLPMAMRNLSWHPQKFLFFNAEAIYDSFWDNEESRGLDFTVRAYKLKKRYADCFTSDDPEMMVETESPAVCMNRFPANDGSRTVYTVYNRAYSTYRGPVLRLPHSSGATYYDAWNDKPLAYTVTDGVAEISLEIGAQEIGCIEVTT